MKSEWESIAHGVAATGVVSMAGVEDFFLRLVSAVIVAATSAVVVHFVRRWLRSH